MRHTTKTALVVGVVSVLFHVELPASVHLETLATDGQGVVLEFIIQGYEIRESQERGALYQKISLEGAGRSSQEGFPLLPRQGLLVGIPEGARPTVTVLDADFEARTDILVSPCPRKVVREENGQGRITEEFYRDERAYGSETFLPGVLAEVEPAGHLRWLPATHLIIHPVQACPARREVRFYTRIRVRVDYGTSLIKRSAERLRIDPSGIYEEMLSRLVVNYDAVKGVTGAMDRALGEPSTGSWLPVGTSAGSGDRVKFGVNVAGIYEVGYDALAGAGYDPAGVDPRNLHLENKGVELPIVVAGEDDGVFHPMDYVLFYGQPEDTLYTDTNIYWLYADDTAGLRIEGRDATPQGSAPVLTSFHDKIHVEKNLTYYQNPRGGASTDHWYWEKRIAPAADTYTVSLENISYEEEAGTLLFSLIGCTDTAEDPDHHTILGINGMQVDEAYWDGFYTYIHEVPITQSQLLEGENSILLSAPGDTGSGVDSYYTNWIEIEYLHAYTAADNLLVFNGEGSGTFGFELSGFSAEDVGIFDITEPAHPVLLTGIAVTAEEDSYTASFEDALNGQRDYIALTPDRRKGPSSIELDAPSDLQSTSNGADYILISTQPLMGAAQTLAGHRAAEGFRVKVVDVEDIYDEFNHGILSPQVIREFLQYAYEHWEAPAPLYVLLFGDASYDFRDYLGEGFAYPLPALLVDRTLNGQTPTDHPFACVSGDDDLPDLFLGRIAVRESSMAQQIVEKLIAYENLDQSLWMRRTIFAADEGENFSQLSESMVQSSIPDYYLMSRFYLDDYGPGAESHLKWTLNGGALTTTYIGHGSITGWSSTHLLRAEEIEQLENDERWTFVLVATCNNAFFAHPHWKLSMAEQFLHFRTVGAIGAFSPIGLSWAYSDVLLLIELFQELFNAQVPQLGAATTAAKISALINQGVDRDVVMNYEYLGDPALSLKVEDPDGDEDQDGLVNHMDNCPFTENPEQQDQDGDNRGDVCDNCPDASNPDQSDLDQDGLGDVCDPEPNPDSDCFIASAAYGHSLDGKVHVLRKFRNDFMLSNEIGQGIVRAYYTYSPPVASFLTRHGSLKTLVRVMLLPLVGLAALFV